VILYCIPSSTHLPPLFLLFPLLSLSSSTSSSLSSPSSLSPSGGLLNLRGSDIDYNPLFFSYAIITTDTVRLYIDADRLTDEIKEHLCVGSEGGVTTRDYCAIWDDVKSLTDSEGKIWINSESSQGLVSLVPKGRRVGQLSPIQLLKAVKNETESRGMRAAHVREQREAGEKDWERCPLFRLCPSDFFLSVFLSAPTVFQCFAPSKTLAYTERFVQFSKAYRQPKTVVVT
jgi:hypothetical protein